MPQHEISITIEMHENTENVVSAVGDVIHMTNGEMEYMPFEPVHGGQPARANVTGPCEDFLSIVEFLLEEYPDIVVVISKTANQMEYQP